MQEGGSEGADYAMQQQQQQQAAIMQQQVRKKNMLYGPPRSSNQVKYDHGVHLLTRTHVQLYPLTTASTTTAAPAISASCVARWGGGTVTGAARTGRLHAVCRARPTASTATGSAAISAAAAVLPGTPLSSWVIRLYL